MGDGGFVTHLRRRQFMVHAGASASAEVETQRVFTQLHRQGDGTAGCARAGSTQHTESSTIGEINLIVSSLVIIHRGWEIPLVRRGGDLVLPWQLACVGNIKNNNHACAATLHYNTDRRQSVARLADIVTHAHIYTSCACPGRIHKQYT